MTEMSPRKRQVWTICLEWIASSNYAYACFFSHSMKIRDFLKYLYAGLLEYVLIVEVYFWFLSEYWVQSYICCGIIHCSIFLSLRGILILVRCPIILSTYRSICPVYVWWALCMMNVPYEKIKKPKTSKVLFKEWLIALDQISDVCSSCSKVTLTSLAK